MKVSVKIVNKSHHALPSYSTLFSAGMDIRANLSEPVTLAPMERPVDFYRAFYRFARRIRGSDTSAQRVGVEAWYHDTEFSGNDRCRLSGRGRYHRVERFGQAVYHRRRRAYLPNGGERVLSGRVE